MKLYKKALLSLAGVSAACGAFTSLQSCTDLTEHPYNLITSERYEFTDADRAAMFLPVYSSLRDFVWGWFGFTDISDMASDLWCVPYRIGVGWGDLYIPTHKHTFHSEIGFFDTAWERAYAGVNACNTLLRDELICESDASVNELRGYRALYYYFLFDMFRNIPLDKGELHEAGWLPEQAAPQETWDYIISELKDIKGSFSDHSELGRFNNATVCMLLAKMYLQHNSYFPEHADESWYKLCIDELDEIMAMGYSLASTYSENFALSIAACPETIFAIPYEEDYAGGNYYANLWMCNAGRATWNLVSWATSGGGALPQFIETYDVDDKRYKDCWISGPQYDINGDPIYIDGVQLNYTHELRSIDVPGCYEQEGERLVKYFIQEKWGTSYDDQVIFRYADALMMKAECLLRITGSYKGENENTAADLVTQVRMRSFPTNPAKATRTAAQLRGGSCYQYGHRENTAEMDQPDNWIITYEGGSDIELGGLLDELAWEFLAEGHRRQDLIRFMMSNGCNVWNGKSWFCKDGINNPADRHADIFPIPKGAALDGNPKLKQNPGYSDAAAE